MEFTELTSSWIRRVSDSLAVSARRISELTEKMEASKYTPVTSERPKENENANQVQVNSAPSTPKKKEKSVPKKKSSLKLSKLGSSSYVHPTIHEVDEEKGARRTESRQTQLSCSSSTRETSARSSGSLKRRSSSATSSMIRGVNSGNTKTSKKDSTKQLSSISQEKSSKASMSSRNSLVGKETDENLSRRSSMSQKSSVSSEKNVPGSSSSKTRKPSIKSIGSKQKVEGQTSITSSRAKTLSEDSDISVMKDGPSLSTLIDLYYATPDRRSTQSSLEMYMKLVIGGKGEKHKEKQKKPENKSENSIRFSGDEDQPSDTDESFIIKRDEDVTDDEASQDDKKEELPETEDKVTENDSSQSKRKVDTTFSQHFENLINEVTSKHETSRRKSRGSINKNKNESGQQKRNSTIEKKLLSERQVGNKLPVKARGYIQTKRNSKQEPGKKETNKNSELSTSRKSGPIELKENQSNPPVLDKRKTLASDEETIKYLTSKKIISLSTMRAVRMKNKISKEQNTCTIIDLPQVQAV